MRYEAPKIIVMGSVAELTLRIKVISPTSDGDYLHLCHHKIPLDTQTS
jgi:hypothetical protein